MLHFPHMKRLLAAILIFAGLAGILWFVMFGMFSGEGSASFSFGESVAETASQVIRRAAETVERSEEAVKKTIATPPPLAGSLTGPSAELSIEGILTETNRHRAEAGLPALTLNVTLNAAADIKVDDMFAQQYFEHESPDGFGPSDLVERVGYDYLAVGENLALGNYEGDGDLVQAWMDSPGHRENILASSFSEIGISVGRGTYEGHTTWLAVQTFARPASDCSEPDEGLSASIESGKAELEAEKTKADALLAELEASDPKSPGERREYNRNVDRYNASVKRINALISEIQGQVTVYNGQVQAFNACVGG